MAFKHFVLSLDGTVQRLSAALPDTTPSGIDDVPLRTVILQPRGTNANPIFVGDDAAITSTDYGFRLEAAAATIPPAPFILGEHDHGPMKLSNFFVLGTSGQFLHIGVVPF